MDTLTASRHEVQMGPEVLAISERLGKLKEQRRTFEARLQQAEERVKDTEKRVIEVETAVLTGKSKQGDLTKVKQSHDAAKAERDEMQDPRAMDRAIEVLETELRRATDADHARQRAAVEPEIRAAVQVMAKALQTAAEANRVLFEADINLLQYIGNPWPKWWEELRLTDIDGQPNGNYCHLREWLKEAREAGVID